MASLVKKVQKKMSIYAHEKVRGLLDGEYGSVFKGRSMDFDDLRAYIPGDDIKDIDWKATARSTQTLVKRYIAVRKHNILFVVDTGKDMRAAAGSGEKKLDVAIMAVGSIGYLAQKHGDLIAMVSGDSSSVRYTPLKGSLSHLERILQTMQSQSEQSSQPSNIFAQLEYVAKSIRRKMMIIVVTDDITISDAQQRLIARLRAQHEVLWMTVGDFLYAKQSDTQIADVMSEEALPQFLYRHPSIVSSVNTAEKKRAAHHNTQLKKLGIVSGRVTHEKNCLDIIFALLERQKHARR